MDDDDNPLAHAIKTVVLSSVRTLLDHAALVDLRDLEDVQYRDDRLVLVAENGRHLFGKLDVDDRNVLEGFSKHDALEFVQEFQRVKKFRN